MAIERVPVDSIHGDKYAPQKNLVANIKKYGILHPILLQRNGGGEGYRIVAGRKRYAAALWAGLTDVPAIVLDTNANSDMIALSENLHRSDSPALEAEIFKRLIDGGMSELDIARELDVSQGKVSQRIGLLRLIPEHFESLKTGLLLSSVARELSTLSAVDQRRFLEEDPTLEEIRNIRRQHKVEAISAIPLPEPPPAPKEHTLITVKSSRVGAPKEYTSVDEAVQAVAKILIDRAGGGAGKITITQERRTEDGQASKV